MCKREHGLLEIGIPSPALILEAFFFSQLKCPAGPWGSLGVVLRHSTVAHNRYVNSLISSDSPGT